MRINNQFALSANYGGVYFVIFDRSNSSGIVQSLSFSLGYIAPSRKFEIETGILFLFLGEESDFDNLPLFRFMLCWSPF